MSEDNKAYHYGILRGWMIHANAPKEIMEALQALICPPQHGAGLQKLTVAVKPERSPSEEGKAAPAEGVKKNNRKVEDWQIVELHKQGKTVLEMAKILSVTPVTIYKKYKKLGLTPYRKGGWGRKYSGRQGRQPTSSLKSSPQQENYTENGVTVRVCPPGVAEGVCTIENQDLP